MAKRKKTSKKSSSYYRSMPTYSKDFSVKARKFMLILIPVIGVIMIITIAFSLLYTPERRVTSIIESLASDYYENNFYEHLINSENYSGNPEDALQEYQEIGLSRVNLRQLLLYDQAKTADVADYLLNYCDKNGTSVKFYPEPPYTRTSYRAEYTYSCNF